MALNHNTANHFGASHFGGNAMGGGSANIGSLINYKVPARLVTQQLQKFALLGGKDTFTIDYNAYSDVAGDIDNFTWSVIDGWATLSNEAKFSNIASVLITTAKSGESLLLLTATAGNNIHKTYIKVVANDPFTIIK